MENSLLSQSLNYLLPVILVIDQEVLEGAYFVVTSYGGSISLLGISIIGLGIIGSVPLLMMIGLDLEVPGLGFSSSLTKSRLPFHSQTYYWLRLFFWYFMWIQSLPRTMHLWQLYSTSLHL